MKIGDKVFVHGYVDEIRKDIIIIRNEGGYFGTVPDEILPSAQPEKRTEERTKTHACDLISRQAAIDAIEDYLDEYSGLDEEGYHGEKWCAMAEAKMVIENLPPAQPEPSDAVYRLYKRAYEAGQRNAQPEPHYDEWCTDCKEYDKERRRCPRWNKVIRETLKDAQPERKKGKWIERNPQNSDKCRLIECNQCGFSHIVGFNVPYEHWIENRNFCERCGADMRGKQDDESRSNSNVQTDTRARGMGTADKSSGI